MRNFLLGAVLLPAGIAMAAETSGNGSGLRLSLVVAKTEVAARQPLAARVSLQNVGKRAVDIADAAFDDRKGVHWGFSKNNSNNRHFGIHFVLTGADGKEIPWHEPPGRHCPDDLFGRSGVPTEAEMREALFRVETDVLARSHVERWVDENTSDRDQRRRLKDLIGPKKVSLEPGRALTTGSFTYSDECLKAPQAGTDTGFAHLLGYRLPKGRYRLSAAYTIPGPKVLVRTPAVEITVR